MPKRGGSTSRFINRQKKKEEKFQNERADKLHDAKAKRHLKKAVKAKKARRRTEGK